MSHCEEKAKWKPLRFSLLTFLLVPLLVSAFLAGRLSFKRQLELEYEQRVQKEIVEVIDFVSPLFDGMTVTDGEKLRVLKQLKTERDAANKR